MQCRNTSPFLEIALVLERFNYVAGIIVNSNQASCDLSHFSPGDKIENCSAQFLAVWWVVHVELKLHRLRHGFSVSNALLLGQSARLSRNPDPSANDDGWAALGKVISKNFRNLEPLIP